MDEVRSKRDALYIDRCSKWPEYYADARAEFVSWVKRPVRPRANLQKVGQASSIFGCAGPSRLTGRLPHLPAVCCNFAISFTIISILTGAVALFGTGMFSAGPVAASLGWPIVAVFVVLVALSMAELASAYPTAGGLYYWASKLGGPAWGWYTGWFNLLGQFAITAGIDYGLAFLTDFWAALKFPPFPTAVRAHPITYAILLRLPPARNRYGIRLAAPVNNVDEVWDIACGRFL